ncbi:hypothetical protein KC323_g126 [Hortaea werneckii]|nr:hypothetical protein KC323_g126 [Hortaea werneckii]
MQERIVELLTLTFDNSFSSGWYVSRRGGCTIIACKCGRCNGLDCFVTPSNEGSELAVRLLFVLVLSTGIARSKVFTKSDLRAKLHIRLSGLRLRFLTFHRCRTLVEDALEARARTQRRWD